ncbi:hypothetical protein [Ensifer soli]|uniref:hypothetical protein n=1 Tax=Ciceribacter sp. sgz301302 TaxID=3342379 RepID=UPI0035BA1833
MPLSPLEDQDVAALARASGLDATPERVATLAATLPIVNTIRAGLWGRTDLAGSEPRHLFAPADGEGGR